MLSKILVPVRGDGMKEAVVAHAAALAKQHNAHVVVAHCRTNPEEFSPFSRHLPGFARDTFVKQAQELADQEEVKLRGELHALAEKLGLSETDEPQGDTATVAFIEEFGSMADVIKHHGRLADLIVVAKPNRDRNLGTNSLKSGLFRTGRPVLMCPPSKDVPADLGAHLAIGWNGSLEAARSVALTLDLAKKAETVTILSGGKGEPHGATTEELIDYSALRGIKATSVQFDDRNPGAALLHKTVEAGANLLVMGAYGHSHERETLFGGNTQTVVDKAEIPVVLVH
jgi:nucleotide-binding universal stress UspA family protein